MIYLLNITLYLLKHQTQKIASLNIKSNSLHLAVSLVRCGTSVTCEIVSKHPPPLKQVDQLDPSGILVHWHDFLG